jgi:hypothetical protein
MLLLIDFVASVMNNVRQLLSRRQPAHDDPGILRFLGGAQATYKRTLDLMVNGRGIWRKESPIIHAIVAQHQVVASVWRYVSISQRLVGVWRSSGLVSGRGSRR